MLKRCVAPLLLTLGLIRPAASAPDTYRMLSNQPFATQAHGVAGALGVELPPGRAPAETNRLVAEAVASTARQMNPRLSALVRALRRLPRNNPRARLFVDRPSLLVSRGRIVLPELTSRSRAGNGTLTVVPEGWSTEDTARLQNFIAEVLPVIEQVYGKPAFTLTVTLKKDSTLAASTDPHLWIMGSYNASSNTILMPPFGSGGADSFDADPEAEWNVTHMLLHAFHDDAQFTFDAWEEGFVRAASIVVMAQLRGTFVEQVLRVSPNWKGPNYEQQNHPELAAASFFNGFELMAVQRLWAAPMAWLKVYAERPTFFKDLNDAYYAQLDPQATVPLSGNVPALKLLASTLVPTVENVPFHAWFNQQHILNSSVFTGAKLYAAAFPSVTSLPNTTDLGYGPNLWLQYFQTGTDGTETPLSGEVEFEYNNDSSPAGGLFAEEGNKATLTDGVGLHSPLFFNVGGPNRIDVSAWMGAFFRVLPYAHEVVGTISGGVTQFSDLSGAVLGSTTGKLSVSVISGKQSAAAVADVTRSVFSVPNGTLDLSGPVKLSFTYTPDSGPAVTFQRNVAYDYYVLQFTAQETATNTVRQAFTAGEHLFSVPIRPTADDEAAALGIDSSRLLLAQYQPRKTAGANDPDRWELYPNLSSRMGPGQGYFVKLLADVTLEVEGALTSAAENFERTLPSGFSLLGQPFNHQTAVSDLQIRIGHGDPVSLSTAQGSGLVGRGLWKSNGAGGYALETSTLDPWNAYWIRITNPDGATVVIPPTSRSRSPLSGGRGRGPLGEALPAGSWYFRIAARTDGATDYDNFLGVAPGAADGVDSRFDIVQPPDTGRYISLYFPAADRAGFTKLAADFRSPVAGAKSWDMVVETNAGGSDCHLTWGDLSQLPNRLRPVLVDLDGGVSRYMRTSAGYTFRAEPGVSQRRLRVVLDGAPGSRLTIGAIAPVRGPRGLQISYTVSDSAAVTAKISTGGRLVRRLSSGRAAHPGLNSLFWDLRDERGQGVPAGFYVVELSATDDTGRAVRAVRPVQVRR